MYSEMSRVPELSYIIESTTQPLESANAAMVQGAFGLHRSTAQAKFLLVVDTHVHHVVDGNLHFAVYSTSFYTKQQLRTPFARFGIPLFVCVFHKSRISEVPTLE